MSVRKPTLPFGQILGPSCVSSLPALLHEVPTILLTEFVLLSAFIVGVGLGQGGFFQHDLGHNAGFSKGSKYNYPAHVFIFNTLIGGSADWWRGRHNRHHAFPNHEDVDLDIRTLPLFAWDEEQLCKAYQKGFTNVKYQKFYFTFFGPPVVFILYRILLIFWVIRHKLWLELAAFIGYFVWIAAIVLPKMEYNLLYLALWHFVVLVTSGTYLGWIFALNHSPLPVLKGAKTLNWVESTCATTQNVIAAEGPGFTQWFLDWFTGHLNYQVEHHLFPNMPRTNYPALHLMLKPIIQGHGIEFREATFWQAVDQVYDALGKTAEKGVLMATSASIGKSVKL